MEKRDQEMSARHYQNIPQPGWNENIKKLVALYYNTQKSLLPHWKCLDKEAAAQYPNHSEICYDLLV